MIDAETGFRVEVIADNSGIWAGNNRTFPTVHKAEAYARDLTARWSLVREWRVVPVLTNMDAMLDGGAT